MPKCSATIFQALVLALGLLRAEEPLQLPALATKLLPRGGEARLTFPPLEAGATYALEVAVLSGDLTSGEEVKAEVHFSGTEGILKTLHAGDPGLYLPFRPAGGGGPAGAGESGVHLHRSPAGGERPLAATLRLVRLGGPLDAARLEAEPNDSHLEANPLEIGVTVEGSGDDVEYLDHRDEGRRGLDWFRFEIGRASCRERV